MLNSYLMRTERSTNTSNWIGNIFHIFHYSYLPVGYMLPHQRERNTHQQQCYAFGRCTTTLYPNICVRVREMNAIIVASQNEAKWNVRKMRKNEMGTRILSKQPSLNVIEIRVTGKRAEHINEEKQMKSKCFINSIVGNCFQHINVLVFRCIKYIFSRQSVTSTSTFNQKMTMTAATTTKRNG